MSRDLGTTGALVAVTSSEISPCIYMLHILLLSHILGFIKFTRMHYIACVAESSPNLGQSLLIVIIAGKYIRMHNRLWSLVDHRIFLNF